MCTIAMKTLNFVILQGFHTEAGARSTCAIAFGPDLAGRGMAIQVVRANSGPMVI